MFSFPIWETMPFPAMPSIPIEIEIPAVYLIPTGGLRYYSSGELTIFQGSKIYPVKKSQKCIKKEGGLTFYS
jgi:hypothetical protein